MILPERGEFFLQSFCIFLNPSTCVRLVQNLTVFKVDITVLTSEFPPFCCSVFLVKHCLVLMYRCR